MIPSSYYPSFVPPAYRNYFTIIIGAAILVAIYFVGVRLGWWKGFLSKPGGDKVDVTEANLPAGFNARNEAVGIKQLLDSWDLNPMQDDNQEAFEKLLSYNDDQLKAVHNAWLTEYKGTGYPTLKSQVQAETLFSSEEIAMQKKILDKMTALGI